MLSAQPVLFVLLLSVPEIFKIATLNIILYPKLNKIKNICPFFPYFHKCVRLNVVIIYIAADGYFPQTDLGRLLHICKLHVKLLHSVHTIDELLI